jgi:hypothetical protein
MSLNASAQTKSGPVKVHPNLKKERDACDFNQAQLSEFMWGGEDKLKKHLKYSKLFANDPVMRNHPKMYDYNREELIEEAYRRLHRMHEIMGDKKMNYTNILYFTLLTMGLVIDLYQFLILFLDTGFPPSHYV